MALASGPRSGQLLLLFNLCRADEKATEGRILYKHDKSLIAAIDLPAALGLLTRLPVAVDGTRAMERGAASAWAYPLVGVVLGVIVGCRDCPDGVDRHCHQGLLRGWFWQARLS